MTDFIPQTGGRGRMRKALPFSCWAMLAMRQKHAHAFSHQFSWFVFRPFPSNEIPFPGLIGFSHQDAFDVGKIAAHKRVRGSSAANGRGGTSAGERGNGKSVWALYRIPPTKGVPRSHVTYCQIMSKCKESRDS